VPNGVQNNHLGKNNSILAASDPKFMGKQLLTRHAHKYKEVGLLMDQGDFTRWRAKIDMLK